MKLTLLILFIIHFSTPVLGQSYALIVDSITKQRIDQCGEVYKRYFKKIKANRKFCNWQTRLDSLNFDYAFIEETVCLKNRSTVTTERYFVKGDTIPKYVFINDQYQDPQSIYNGGFVWYSKNVVSKQTLYPLLDQYAQLKPVQELPYDTTQIWEHGCVIYGDCESEFTKQRRAALKRTYQIQTLVDKVNNNIVLSAQYAPENPQFHTRSYNAVWDW